MGRGQLRPRWSSLATTRWMGGRRKDVLPSLERGTASLDKVEVVVVMDGVDMPDHPKSISWSDFLASGSDMRIPRSWKGSPA